MQYATFLNGARLFDRKTDRKVQKIEFPIVGDEVEFSLRKPISLWLLKALAMQLMTIRKYYKLIKSFEQKTGVNLWIISPAKRHQYAGQLVKHMEETGWIGHLSRYEIHQLFNIASLDAVTEWTKQCQEKGLIKKKAKYRIISEGRNVLLESHKTRMNGDHMEERIVNEMKFKTGFNHLTDGLIRWIISLVQQKEQSELEFWRKTKGHRLTRKDYRLCLYSNKLNFGQVIGKRIKELTIRVQDEIVAVVKMIQYRVKRWETDKPHWSKPKQWVEYLDDALHGYQFNEMTVDYVVDGVMIKSEGAKKYQLNQLKYIICNGR